MAQLEGGGEPFADGTDRGLHQGVADQLGLHIGVDLGVVLVVEFERGENRKVCGAGSFIPLHLAQRVSHDRVVEQGEAEGVVALLGLPQDISRKDIEPASLKVQEEAVALNIGEGLRRHGKGETA